MPFVAVRMKRQGNSQTHYVIPFIPVGTILFAASALDLATIYGGTWSRVDDGRTLVCIDTSNTNFNTVGKTGGGVNLQSHKHTVTSAAGASHKHNYSHYHGTKFYCQTVEVGNCGLISRRWIYRKSCSNRSDTLNIILWCNNYRCSNRLTCKLWLRNNAKCTTITGSL